MQLQKLFDEFLCYLRYCHNCRSTYERVDLFCEHCWSTLIAQINVKTRVINNIKVTSLWTWREENTQIGLMINGLKMGTLRPAYYRLINIIESRHLALLRPNQIYVPSPQSIFGASKNKIDHAYVLAKMLAQQNQGIFEDRLCKNSERKQKWLNKKERAELLINLKPQYHEKNTQHICSDRVLFVDDVVTTGSTFLKSYIALQRPVNFEVFSLVYRPNLAASERL